LGICVFEWYAIDELKALQSLGLTMPSPAYLIGAIFFGIVGFAGYRYGKKMSLVAVKWIGVTLMLYPCLVSDTWLLYTLGCGLCVALSFSRA
jgi:hypothetical protein